MDRDNPSLQDIALGMMARTIFTNFDLPHEPDDEVLARTMQMVFLPLWFLEEGNAEAADKFMKGFDMPGPRLAVGLPKEGLDDIGMVWEFYDQAGPRSINGLPQFFSCRVLSKEKTRKVIVLLKRLMAKEAATTPEDKAHHELLFWKGE